MIQGDNDFELSSEHIQMGFRYFSYISFAGKDITNEGKPEFLKIEQMSVRNFQDYAKSNIDVISEELNKISDVIERTCIAYGLLKQFGDDVCDNEDIALVMLQGYSTLIDLARNSDAENTFIDGCLNLMLPTVLPYLDMQDNLCRTLSHFEKISKAKNLVNTFYTEYKFPKAENLGDSLLHLLNLFYFLSILLQQDCQGLKVADIESLVLFVKSKMGDFLLELIEQKSLLQNESLGMIYCCLRILDEMDNAPNANIYRENKSLLCSLILDILIPSLSSFNKNHNLKLILTLDLLKNIAFGDFPISEKLRLDIYIALFNLGNVDMDFMTATIVDFSIDALIEMVEKIYDVVSLGVNNLAHVMYIGLIIQKSILSKESCSIDNKNKFFLATKDVISKALISAMFPVAQLFYQNPRECYSGLLHNEKHKQDYLSDSGKLDINSFFIILSLYKDYSNIFPEAQDLLPKLYVTHLVVMRKNNYWSNNASCLLLKKVGGLFESCGIYRKHLDFITVKDACNSIAQRVSDGALLSLVEEDLVFFQNLFEVFPTISISAKNWTKDQNDSIDKICEVIIANLSFKEGHDNVILDIRLASIITSLISDEARLKFYAEVDKILTVINAKSSESPIGLAYHIVLIKRWLLDYVKKGDMVVNSRVLDQLKIFPQYNSSITSQLLYMSQLADVIYGITNSSSYFYAKDALHSKLNELIAFVLEERVRLHDLLTSVKELPSDRDAHVLMNDGSKFCDKDLISILNTKYQDLSFDEVKFTLRKNVEVISITGIEFSKDKIIFCSTDRQFSLPLTNFPTLNVLRSRVYNYKDQGKFYLSTDYGSCKLLQLTIEVNPDNQDDVAPTLTDNELFDLFESKSSKTPNGKKSNKAKNKAQKSETVVRQILEDAPVKIAESGKNNKKKKKSKNKPFQQFDKPASEDINIEASGSFANVFSWEDRLTQELDLFQIRRSEDDLNLICNRIVSLIESRFGFRVGFKLVADDLVYFSLGASQVLLDSSKNVIDLCELFANLPTQFLAETGADSFARIVYSAEGKAVSVALSEPLVKYFDIRPHSIKEGDIVKALKGIEGAFLDGLQKKLRTQVALDGAMLSLIINISNEIEDVRISEPCDLRLIKAEILWDTIIFLHGKLLQQRFGGNMALLKPEFDAENNLIAYNISNSLLKEYTYLQRVIIVEDKIIEALGFFFSYVDIATFKIFKRLDYQHAEFVLKAMKAADVDLVIYGHPVIDCLYSDLMQSLAVARQRLKNFVVSFNYVRKPDIKFVIGMLTSLDFGAVIKGVTKDAIYCEYNSYSVTVCVNSDYMAESIFYGDRFSCVLGKGVLSYCESNPSGLSHIIALDSEIRPELFLDNPYVLQTTMYWHKIMGKLGGGLRKALQKLGFVRFITSPNLESIVWKKGVNSCEFLPGASDYLRSQFHLSNLDAEEILTEVKMML